MFQPRFFKQTNTQQMLAFIAQHPMASIVSMSSDGLIGNHIPMLVVQRQVEGEQEQYYLQGHVARANSLCKDIDSSTDVLAMFIGPDGYVSPNWYPSKKTDPRTVPTWNYVAVHVTGKISFYQDKEWLKKHLENLSRTHETKINQSWQLSDAPDDYIDKMLKAIVGIEININNIKGNTKMSQNHSAENRQGVIEGLTALGQQEVASWVKNPNPYSDE